MLKLSHRTRATHSSNKHQVRDERVDSVVKHSPVAHDQHQAFFHSCNDSFDALVSTAVALTASRCSLRKLPEIPPSFSWSHCAGTRQTNRSNSAASYLSLSQPLRCACAALPQGSQKAHPRNDSRNNLHVQTTPQSEGCCECGEARRRDTFGKLRVSGTIQS